MQMIFDFRSKQKLSVGLWQAQELEPMPKYKTVVFKKKQHKSATTLAIKPKPSMALTRRGRGEGAPPHTQASRRGEAGRQARRGEAEGSGEEPRREGKK